MYKLQRSNMSDKNATDLLYRIRDRKPFSLQLTGGDLQGSEYPLFLTNAQLKQFEKAKAENKGITLKLSKQQLLELDRMRNSIDGPDVGLNKVAAGLFGSIGKAIVNAVKPVISKAVPGLGDVVGTIAESGINAIDKKISKKGKGPAWGGVFPDDLPNHTGGVEYGDGSGSGIDYSGNSLPYGSGASYTQRSLPYGSGITPFGGRINPYGLGASYTQRSLPYGSGITPFGDGITPFGYGVTPFGYGMTPFGGGTRPHIGCQYCHGGKLSAMAYHKNIKGVYKAREGLHRKYAEYMANMANTRSGSGIYKSSLGALTHEMLYEYANKLQIPSFHVVMHDDLVDKIVDKNENLNMIVNLDRRPNGNGTHFVAICNDPENKSIYYFDSFGVIPSDIIKKFMKTSGNKCIYNDGESELQEFDSSACGYYCLNFLDRLNNGETYEDLLYKFKQHPSDFNEKKMEEFARKITG